MTGLIRLFLSKNQLTSLPESIGQLTGLTELNLRYNKLTSLPSSIGQLAGLTKLNLQNNQLTSLPESISQLTGLTELYLNNNQLTNLPESISQLTGLTKLNLQNNQLTSLPESISQLTELTTLYLTGNQLTSLPESISQLTRLTYLGLDDNKLTSLPESIGQLTGLPALYLTGNQLTNLPESISQLTGLTKLNLQNNQLTSLPESISQLTELTTLYLTGNQLTSLPESIVRLGMLNYLSLDSSGWLCLTDEIKQWLSDNGKNVNICDCQNIITACTNSCALNMTFDEGCYQTSITINNIDKTGLEDQIIEFNAGDFRSHFTDSNNDGLKSIQIKKLAEYGVLKLSRNAVGLNQVIDANELVNLIFEPQENWFGQTYFQWRASDGRAYSSQTANVTIQLQSVNDAPTVNTITKLGNEDTIIAFNISDFTFKFSDVDDGDSLTKIQIINLSEDGVLRLSGTPVSANKEIAIGNLKDLTFEPNPDWYGNTTFSWQGYDGAVYSSNTATVDITIKDVPEPPEPMSAGAIAGIVCGALSGVSALSAGGFFGFKYYKKLQAEKRRLEKLRYIELQEKRELVEKQEQERLEKLRKERIEREERLAEEKRLAEERLQKQKEAAMTEVLDGIKSGLGEKEVPAEIITTLLNLTESNIKSFGIIDKIYNQNNTYHTHLRQSLITTLITVLADIRETDPLKISQINLQSDIVKWQAKEAKEKRRQLGQLTRKDKIEDTEEEIVKGFSEGMVKSEVHESKIQSLISIVQGILSMTKIAEHMYEPEDSYHNHLKQSFTGLLTSTLKDKAEEITGEALINYLKAEICKWKAREDKERRRELGRLTKKDKIEDAMEEIMMRITENLTKSEVPESKRESLLSTVKGVLGTTRIVGQIYKPEDSYHNHLRQGLVTLLVTILTDQTLEINGDTLFYYLQNEIQKWKAMEDKERRRQLGKLTIKDKREDARDLIVRRVLKIKDLEQENRITFKTLIADQLEKNVDILGMVYEPRDPKHISRRNKLIKALKQTLKENIEEEDTEFVKLPFLPPISNRELSIKTCV